MPSLAAQLVEFPHRHGVTLMDVGHQLAQTFAIITCPGHGVGEGLRGPGGIERGLVLF
jgi:hypothetical protein